MTNRFSLRLLVAFLSPMLLIVGVNRADSVGASTTPPTTDGSATPGWANICKEMPAGFQNASMMSVDPNTGNLYLYAQYKNWKSQLLISKDQGASWTNIPSPVTGGGGLAYSFNVPYPFTGRMVLFTGDGHAGRTLDGGATWDKFDPPPHSRQYGDIDWSSQSPDTMIMVAWVASNGNAVSPAISSDAGKTWKISPPLEGVFGPKIGHRVGVTKVGLFDAKTALMANALSKGVLISHDGGTSWTKTADFKPLGTNPIHYGTKLYWAAAEGVMVTANGSDWNLLGTALPNAAFGPYFGGSENEMMVVTNNGIYITPDAAKTWDKVSEIPVVVLNRKKTSANCFAWDPIHHLVYAILGPSVWRLQAK